MVETSLNDCLFRLSSTKSPNLIYLPALARVSLNFLLSLVIRISIVANAIERVHTDSGAKIESIALLAS
jgi:hypothetical protein